MLANEFVASSYWLNFMRLFFVPCCLALAHYLGFPRNYNTQHSAWLLAEVESRWKTISGFLLEVASFPSALYKAKETKSKSQLAGFSFMAFLKRAKNCWSVHGYIYTCYEYVGKCYCFKFLHSFFVLGCLALTHDLEYLRWWLRRRPCVLDHDHVITLQAYMAKWICSLNESKGHN